MSNDTTQKDKAKGIIRNTIRNQPLGVGDSVKCDDCSGEIDVGETVKVYLIGNIKGKSWKISRAFHDDCGDIFVPARIKNSTDTEALGFGKLVHDPSVSAGGPDESKTYKSGNVNYIESERGVHRLENPDIKVITIMNEERRQERRNSIKQGEEILKKIRDGELDNHPLSDMIQDDKNK